MKRKVIKMDDAYCEDKGMNNISLTGVMLILVCFLTACSSVLPKTEDETKSPWNSFAEAMTAYESIRLNETTVKDLSKLGFNPYTTPNVEILSYLDVIQRFMPNSSIGQEQLPLSVRRCVAKQARCMAYEAHPGTVKRKRVGSMFLDLLKFKRKTIETGWRFNALIVLDEGIVVYKVWSGVPIIDSEKTRKNPLGPLQGSGGSLARDAAGI